MTSRSVAALVALLSGAALAAAQPLPGQSPPPPPSSPNLLDLPSETVPQGVATFPAMSNESWPTGFHFTGSAEYLLWWLKGDRPALPLLTTGGTGGALGASDTTVLFRISDLDKSVPYSGGRFNLGFWATRDEEIGLDVGYFFLEKRTFSFSAGSGSTGSPLLSVPFNDLNPDINSPRFSQVSVPGVLAGTMGAISDTRLWGMEADLKTGLLRTNTLSVDALLGFREADLRERFGFSQAETGLVGYPLLSLAGTPIPAGDSLAITDNFGTHNLFDGCDIGLRTTWALTSKLNLDLTTKIALGSMHETLDVSGSTSHLNPSGGVVQTEPGGLFALWGLNIGNYTHNTFAVLPEAIIRIRYSITDWLDVSVGYDFLYMSNVVRPADQVSGTINSSYAPSQVPYGVGGPLAPAALFHRTDFSAQGVNFGIEVRF